MHHSSLSTSSKTWLNILCGWILSLRADPGCAARPHSPPWLSTPAAVRAVCSALRFASSLHMTPWLWRHSSSFTEDTTVLCPINQQWRDGRSTDILAPRDNLHHNVGKIKWIIVDQRTWHGEEHKSITINMTMEERFCSLCRLWRLEMNFRILWISFHWRGQQQQQQIGFIL